MTTGVIVTLVIACIFWIILMVKHPVLLLVAIGLAFVSGPVDQILQFLLVWTIGLSLLFTKTGHTFLLCFGIGAFLGVKQK